MGDGNYTNKGSLWAMNGFRGKIDISGDTFYVLMVGTGAAPETNAPAYKAIITQGKTDQVVPVWRDSKDENKRVGYFEYADHYVSIFVNEPGQNPNSPQLGLMAQPKDPQQSGSQSGNDAPVNQSDPLPF